VTALFVRLTKAGVLLAVVLGLVLYAISARDPQAPPDGFDTVQLANLAWSSVLSWNFVRGRATLAALERWQTTYLPVYAGWAAVVVVVFPPMFGWV
jgi:hypothetical protein